MIRSCNTVIYSCAYTSTYMQNHNDTISKQTSEDFFRKICTSHFIVKVRKGLLRVLLWEGVEDWTKLQYIDTSVVSFSFSRAVQPEAQRPTLPDAGILYHILSPTGLQTPSGVARTPSAGCGFPYYISFLTPTVWLPVLAELYNSSTPT